MQRDYFLTLAFLFLKIIESESAGTYRIFFVVRPSDIDYIPNEVWIPARVSKVIRSDCLDHVVFFMAGAVITRLKTAPAFKS